MKADIKMWRNVLRAALKERKESVQVIAEHPAICLGGVLGQPLVGKPAGSPRRRPARP